LGSPLAPLRPGDQTRPEDHHVAHRKEPMGVPAYRQEPMGVPVCTVRARRGKPDILEPQHLVHQKEHKEAYPNRAHFSTRPFLVESQPFGWTGLPLLSRQDGGVQTQRFDQAERRSTRVHSLFALSIIHVGRRSPLWFECLRTDRAKSPEFVGASRSLPRYANAKSDRPTKGDGDSKRRRRSGPGRFATRRFKLVRVRWCDDHCREITVINWSYARPKGTRNHPFRPLLYGDGPETPFRFSCLGHVGDRRPLECRCFFAEFAVFALRLCRRLYRRKERHAQSA
jgi:hypothetical protein